MAMAANWWPPATWPTETATVKHSKPVPTASMVSFCAVVDMWTLFWARLWQIVRRERVRPTESRREECQGGEIARQGGVLTCLKRRVDEPKFPKCRKHT